MTAPRSTVTSPSRVGRGEAAGRGREPRVGASTRRLAGAQGKGGDGSEPARRRPAHRACQCVTCTDARRADRERRQQAHTIATVTARHFALRTADLYSRSRTDPAPLARQIAMYLCRELTDLSLPKIGQAFGGRDHTTVMHAVAAMRARLEVSLVAAMHVDLIRDAIDDRTHRTTAAPRFTLPFEPLGRLVTDDHLARCDHSARSLFYRARTHGELPATTADLLAVRLLCSHPVAVWGEAWLAGAGERQAS